MNPSLQLKLPQHLALTPQLQQSIRLLQLSTIELEQELEKYLQENPLLEREEEEYATTPPPSPETDAPNASQEATDDDLPSTSTRDDEESWQGDEGNYASTSVQFR